MNKHFCSLVVILSLFAVSGARQTDFPKLTGPYLGQKPPGMTPEIFAPGIVSTPMNAAKIAFSPGGKEIFFRLMNHDHSFMTLVHMEQKKGIWGKPEVAPFSGQYHDGEPFYSPDGSRLFFTSNRPLNGQTMKKDFDIWAVQRKPSGWGIPENLGVVINSDRNEVDPAVSKNGTLYFTSNRDGGRGNSDIYQSDLINGQYSRPENLGDGINTPFSESGPYIAPDESYIIFNRYRSPTGDGLHISYKKKDGSWSEAVSMGTQIDSEYKGFHGIVSPDGRYLFFTSAKNPDFPRPDHRLTYDEIAKMMDSPLNGSYNIYWVDARILEGFTKHPQALIK